MPDSPDTHPLVAVLGRVPSGIYILTVRHEDQETGMLASWVMQAGFQPPMITVAVKLGRYVADWLAAGTPFALNVVAEKQKTLLSHFARGFDPGAPSFDGLAIQHDQHGVPILGEGVVGHLLCRATGHVDSADHRIFLAEVIDGQLTADDSPMLHVRKSGSHY